MNLEWKPGTNHAGHCKVQDKNIGKGKNLRSSKSGRLDMSLNPNASIDSYIKVRSASWTRGSGDQETSVFRGIQSMHKQADNTSKNQVPGLMDQCSLFQKDLSHSLYSEVSPANQPWMVFLLHLQLLLSFQYVRTQSSKNLAVIFKSSYVRDCI